MSNNDHLFTFRPTRETIVTVVDEPGEGVNEDTPAPERPWQGVRAMGSDLRFRNLKFEINLDGTMASSSVSVELRTDIWPHWLDEAIEAAVTADDAAESIPKLVARSDAAEDPEAARLIDEEISAAMFKELRASMRAITACAFALDSFYAAVKARSPQHPQQDSWDRKKPSRHSQVTETLRHHLKINNNRQAKDLKQRVSTVYKFRDWAVHPDSKYKEPVARDDIRASVDWHFLAFRANNATSAVGMTIALFDGLAAWIQNGSQELVTTASFMRERMNIILDEYESHPCLRRFPRVESVVKAIDNANRPATTGVSTE